MAIAGGAATSSPTITMSLSNTNSHEDGTSNSNDNNIITKPTTTTATAIVDDDHEHDMVMPGFRFHPTEEELVEFYLRRKVEGKRFNVELITFLDLYRYDPWELPALAAIGEKEWYFYVPRDRKYRNGDRPNRVTTSGYWKATGADRMIRTENFRSIGLKKTLVFYSGKAPKGIRTSWIMNEYRLPQHETERYQKGEISLCRVYKRAGVEDHPSLPRCLPITRPSSIPSSSRNSEKNKQNETLGIGFVVGQSAKIIDNNHQIVNKMDGNNNSSGGDCSSDQVTTALGLSKYNNNTNPIYSPEEEEQLMMMQQQQQQQQQQPRQLVQYAGGNSLLVSACGGGGSIFPVSATSASCSNNGSSSTSAAMMMDDLNRLVSYQQQQYCYNVQSHSNPNPNHLSNLLMQPMSLPNQLPTTFPDRLWDWNPIPEDHNHNHPNSNTSNFKLFF
ncbi:NAC domain-containing protein 35-like [Vicia villosa]|uniref:NAC domain-containing protein 35-like n=1 Tax=Vicia villosa TaxID=3911 RepID=UPI00273C2D7E|nr:NAC domain-containing protein 35-like [Vicia villosa]